MERDFVVFFNFSQCHFFLYLWCLLIYDKLYMRAVVIIHGGPTGFYSGIEVLYVLFDRFHRKHRKSSIK